MRDVKNAVGQIETRNVVASSAGIMPSISERAPGAAISIDLRGDWYSSIDRLTGQVTLRAASRIRMASRIHRALQTD